MRLTDQKLYIKSNIELEKQLNYWKQQLAGATPVLELPTDRPRLPVQNHEAAREFLVLSKKLTQGLKTLSQRSDTTLSITLLAAFKILLYRYTVQELTSCTKKN